MKINISTLVSTPEANVLEVVRLSADELPLVFFTDEGEQVALHYCHEPDIGSYVHCAEDGCVLCQIGRGRQERVLLPVYVPTASQVQVLSASTSLRPNALLPQLAEVLAAEEPCVVFVRRERWQHFVSVRPFPPDADAGESAIKQFQARCESDAVQLGSVYPRLDNAQLKALPEIEQLLTLKGLA